MKLAVALVLVLGCSHEAKPTVQPDDHPPLPPAAGTPVGYLVDASELALRDDQLTKLKAIDVDLSERLDALDGQLRGGGTKPDGAQPSGRRRGGGGRRGGFGGGGGRRGGGGAGNGAGSGSASATPPRGRPSAADVNRLTDQRTAAVREALQRALAVLDPAQQPIAKRVLSDHGVDVDTDHPDDTPAGSGSDN
jgi:hypothetical protein